jgi:lantibiotic modifying enzyme
MNLGPSCDGAIGIALARLGCVRFADIPDLRFDLEEALSIVRSLPERDGDQICCGNFGRIDVLYAAGDILSRLHLVDYARESSRRIVARSTTDGFSFTPSRHEDVVKKHPGFDGSLFFGLAGIGYVLLRLNNPGIFPAVLLLDVER